MSSLLFLHLDIHQAYQYGWKNMVTKFFQNSNFSDFLGIKSEISQYIQELIQGLEMQHI